MSWKTYSRFLFCMVMAWVQLVLKMIHNCNCDIIPSTGYHKKCEQVLKRTTRIWSQVGQQSYFGRQTGDFGGNAHRGTRWHLVQSFGGPFHSKITWAGTEGSVFLLFVHWNRVHIAEVSDQCNWIPFGRDCKDWKCKDLKFNWCRQRIWLWGEMGQQNCKSRWNLIGC